ncbi:branched-chain amino acid ABC transporter permease [Roseomonas stagni]|uniref:Branched-chain amino acid ABC transporter permease n=1 Tax=Falsiroseomonas algicola TaxID=2716930 RepID=A0A6M1LKE7_9PROT|nr:branched-chain amino acid ABC transporter permease [Falsiroseomonas algicola]NGM20810.1 branched-chain amino acid ABC transporter permease [Falsiroseomonas algicola]
MSGYWSGILAILAINIIFAYGIFVTATAGQLNLGGAGFMAIGAYGAAMLGEQLGWTPALTVPAATLLTALVGIGIAFPVLRTRGVYMVLATFAFAQVVTGIILTQPALGGAMGLVVTEYVDLPVLLGVAAAVTIGVFWLTATRLGLAMRALHDDELVAVLMGVPARAVQVAGFAIGGGLAGLAGALYAHHFSFVEAQYFSPLLSIYVLLFVLIGGTQTAWGPLVGASFFTIVPELLRIGGSWRYVVFGVMIVAMMMFRPEGMVTRTLLARLMGRRRHADAG